jgi:hypothetical protein
MGGAGVEGSGNMGMSGNGNMGAANCKASSQWGDNQFRFLEVPEKNAYFYFFLKKIAAP